MRQEAEVNVQKKKRPRKKITQKYTSDVEECTSISHWGTKPVTKKLLLHLASHSCQLANGDIVVDYEKRLCGYHDIKVPVGGQADCVSVYTIRACGCITRKDLHTILDNKGDVVFSSSEEVSPARARLPQCKGHKMHTREFLEY